PLKRRQTARPKSSFVSAGGNCRDGPRVLPGIRLSSAEAPPNRRQITLTLPTSHQRATVKPPSCPCRSRAQQPDTGSHPPGLALSARPATSLEEHRHR